jgi:hypothetical protein
VVQRRNAALAVFVPSEKSPNGVLVKPCLRAIKIFFYFLHYTLTFRGVNFRILVKSLLDFLRSLSFWRLLVRISSAVIVLVSFFQLF